MRILLFSMVLLCASFSSFAQKFQVKWGLEYKKEGGMFSRDFLLGSDGKYFYVLSDPRGKAKVLKFDFTCKLLTATPITFSTGGKEKAQVGGMLTMKNKTYLVLASRNKKADVVTFYYTELKNGTFSPTVKSFYSIPFSFNFGSALSLGYGFASMDATESGDFKKSPSGNVVAIAASGIGVNKAEVIKISVLDENLKVLWEKPFPLKVSDRNIYIEQYVVNDKGEVFIAAKQWDSKESYKKGIPKYDYKVYKFTESGMEESTIKLDGDKAPWDAGLFPTPDGGVNLGGFYTKTSTPKGSADGVFFSMVDESNKVKSSAYAFTDEFLEGLQTKKQDKKDQGITRFSIDYLVRFPDGTYSFIAEKYYITTYTTTDSKGNTTTTTIYHSDEIVIPRFSATGELLSMAKVEKTFSYRNTPIFTSYSFFIKDNSIVLVYNDFKTREERKSSGKGRAIYTDICYVSENGDVKIDNIFTSKDVEKYYVPGSSVDLGNGKHVVKAIKGKMYTYGVISL
jgi:hypothetical protein